MLFFWLSITICQLCYLRSRDSIKNFFRITTHVIFRIFWKFLSNAFRYQYVVSGSCFCPGLSSVNSLIMERVFRFRKNLNVIFKQNGGVKGTFLAKSVDHNDRWNKERNIGGHANSPWSMSTACKDVIILNLAIFNILSRKCIFQRSRRYKNENFPPLQ